MMVNPLALPTFKRLAALMTAAALSACGAGGVDVAGLSGSASMQIDVEVYKGPLSKELDVQKSELVAKVYESGVAVEELIGQTRIAMCALACFDRRSGKASHRRYPVEGSGAENDFAPYPRPQMLAPDKKVLRHGDAQRFCAQRIHDIDIEPTADEKHDVCPVLETMEFDLRSIRGRGQLLDLYQMEEAFTGGGPPADRTCTRIGPGQYTCIKFEQPSADFNLNAANYAEFLHSRAAFFATQQTAIAPKSKRARRAIANFTQFLADYGNQISARVDAILKQEALFKHDTDQTRLAGKTLLARELLANTAYLRDSAPTGYLNLYKFNDASAAKTRRGATDRIRLVEQLTADTYWTRINSVFATGQGRTTFAFIKDDIGNWDLKKFDNSPGELVDAYKSAGLAVLQEVASVASGGAADVNKAGQLLNFADRLNFGGGAATNVQIDAQVKRLRQQTTKRLQTLQTNDQNRYDALSEAIGAAQGNVDATREEVAGATEKANEAMASLNAAIADSNRKRNELAVLEGEKRGLQDALATTEDEGRRTELEAKITNVDDRIKTAQAAVDQADSKATLETAILETRQTALAASKDKLAQQEAALAALKAKQAALPVETARAARQILDNYLVTLEELAQAGAKAPKEKGDGS